MTRARVCAAALLFVILCALSTPAQAFTVASAFSRGCHEGITLTAFRQAQPVLNVDEINVPNGEWEGIADYLFARVGGVVTGSRQDKFFVFSIFVGVRAPDTEGISITNVQSVRNIHAHPEGQYDHCLRALDDDWADGDATAHDGCMRSIIDNMLRAAEEFNAAPGGRVIDVPFTLDHYGNLDVAVWGPAFYIGRAVHAVQDSFAHTVRSDNLRSIYHVMNYAEAIGGTIEEDRDGIAHSDFADMCGSESQEVTFAAIEATADLLRASQASVDGDPQGEVEHVIAKWLLLTPGCTADNDYCGSKWVERAKTDPTGPFLGCGCVHATKGAPWSRPWLLLLPLVVLLWRRRRR